MSTPNPAAHDEFFDSLLGDFLDESGQLLDRLNENLLQLDEWVQALDDAHPQRVSDDLLNDMFRSAHSLKGLSAMLGLTDINGLTHKVENVFDAARKDQLAIDGEVVELMFQAIDRLGALVEGLKTPTADRVECESVVEGITKVLRAAGAEKRQSTQADAERALSSAVEAAASETQNQTPATVEAEPALQPEAAPAASPAPQPPSPAQPQVASASAPSPAPTVDPFAGVQDEAEICGKYLAIFLDEAVLSLDSLTETLLALEGQQTREAIETLLLTSHRIKGSAASVGLNRAAKLAHLMEDQLQDVVQTGGRLTTEITDAMLKCTDALRQYVEDLKRGGVQSVDFRPYAQALLAARQAAESHSEAAAEPKPRASQPVAAASKPDRAISTTSGDIPEELHRTVAQATATTEGVLVGMVRFQPALPLVGLKARLVFEKLVHMGEVLHFQPPPDQLDDLEDLEAVYFGLGTEKSQDAVRNYLRVAGVQQILLAPLAGSPAATDRPASAAAEQADTYSPGQTEPEHVAEHLPPSAAANGAEDSSQPEVEHGEPARGATSQAKGRGGVDSNKPNETLRVDIERLDQLMNLAGQLVISKAHFVQIGDSLKSVLSSKHSLGTLDRICGALDSMVGGQRTREGESSIQADIDSLRGQARRIQCELTSVRAEVESLAHVRGAVNDLFEAIHQLDRVTDGIHQAVMDTRMVPIGPLFTRFKRVVRDITRTNGKLVQLVIRGEKTELDKRMIDELGDPLIHMVRNAADHGIERPEVREKAGKPREGTITLDAFHRGNSIIIQIIDDGKGLDAERILQKAIERGLVTPADGEKMTRQQIYQLIWEPGLSTAEKITEVSGRGVGMDIVKSKIADLNGTVELESAPGQGTTMTIKLPLTLAILPSLMVDVGGDVFALPMESVAEIIRISRKDIACIHGLWTARVREQVVSVVKLDEVFRWGRELLGSNQDDAEITLVIVGHAGRQLGLVVDHVLGEEDVVIKSLAENYRNVPGVAGASILGDGRVSLILDIGTVIEMASHQEPTTVA
jgi:two-component system chemotaxis sensor kinase CheA